MVCDMKMDVCHTMRRIFFIIVMYTLSIRAEENGICKLCAANFYCTENSVTQCPDNSNSPAGSTLKSDCICKKGFPGPPGGECSEPIGVFSEKTVVSFKAAVAMSVAEFDSGKRASYISGVAQSLSVSIESVSIGSVTETISSRRLLATTIAIETIVTVSADEPDPQAAADAITAAATQDNLNAALSSSGIELTAMEPVVVSTVVTVSCPAGTYKNNPGDGFVCTLCGVNQYSVEDAVSCLRCPNDKISAAGSSLVECVCSADTITNDRTGTCDLPGQCVAEDGLDMLSHAVQTHVNIDPNTLSIVCRVTFPSQTFTDTNQ